MKADVCFSPALYPYYNVNAENTIVVVVDIFRATTTMCAAFRNGVRSIIPVATVEEAVLYKRKGFLVGAERNVKRCDFADFGNSPFEYTTDKVAGKDIVFTTTNGTQAIEVAGDCYRLLIGAFSNISAVAGYCKSQGKDVMILCSGWNNRFNMEDTLFAGALVSLLKKENYTLVSDAANTAHRMFMQAKSDIRAYIDEAEHTQRLIANNLADSIEYCLSFDTVSLIPIYDKKSKSLKVSPSEIFID